MSVTFSLDEFEQLVYRQQHQLASVKLVAALALLHDSRGKLDERFLASGMEALPAAEQQRRFCARLASAMSALFAQPDFRPIDDCVKLLLAVHEWIGLLYASASHGNADHVARHLNPRGSGNAEFLAGDTFIEKLCLLYSIESELELDFAALWLHDRKMAACLALALLSPTFKGSASAHLKREALLEWLPGRLQQIDDLDDLPSSVLHNAYMFCSYADTPKRHAIKHDINVLVRRKLARIGLADLPAVATADATPPVFRPANGERHPTRTNATSRKKPLMFVLVEWFTGAHSIYRTHSRTLEAAREHFELVGFGFGYAVDEAGRAVFDRFIELDKPEYVGDCLRTIRELAEAERPEVLYMPSVGMFVLTVFMSNLRVAPLQIAALGHPATTHSDKIDYVSVEEDYVGDPACFTEKLMRLPKDGQPYRPSTALPEITASVPPHRATLQIVITASAMKINPGFLEACRVISERAAVPVEYHFLTGVWSGLAFDHLRHTILRILPNAVVHDFHDYPRYLARVNEADLFLSPFPFGNTNGIVDALTLGLPGVCKRGAEVFERIDAALFERVGMPAWTVADSVDDYVAAALRMIDGHDERAALRQLLIDTQAVQRCFEGRPEAFGESVLKLLGKKKSRRKNAAA